MPDIDFIDLDRDGRQDKGEPKIRTVILILSGILLVAFYFKRKSDAERAALENSNAGNELRSFAATQTSPSNTGASGNATTDAYLSAMGKQTEALSTLVTGGLGTLANSIKDALTATNSAITTLGTKTETSMTNLQNGINTKLSAFDANLTNGLNGVQQSNANISQAITSMSQAIGNIGLAVKPAILEALGTSDTARDRQFFRMVGFQSAASCVKNGIGSASCYSVKNQDYNSVQGEVYNDSQASQIFNELQGKYQGCYNGGRFDLECVGRKLVSG